VVSQRKGTVTIKQRRWLIRLESRLVGRLIVAPIVGGELGLGAVRLKTGGLDGPVYYQVEGGDETS
jgi:hypothetical protein